MSTTETTMSHEQMVKEFMALKAQNATLTAQLAAKPSTNGLGMKVSTKGALSVYGLGRWPVTLYTTQWMALLDRSEAIKQFMLDNKATLKTKSE